MCLHILHNVLSELSRLFSERKVWPTLTLQNLLHFIVDLALNFYPPEPWETWIVWMFWVTGWSGDFNEGSVGATMETKQIHYIAVIMGTIAAQITSLKIVYSTAYSGADQGEHQSSASLAFVRGIHRSRWIPRIKGQYGGKCFHLMTSSCCTLNTWNDPCLIKTN